jgi:transposase
MNTIGIDVSKDKLDSALLRAEDKLKTKVTANKPSGWQELLDWALKNTGVDNTLLHFVMEATGIYHQQLATFLYKAGAKVSVVNPAQVKFYAQSLGVRSKNDKKDSVVWRERKAQTVGARSRRDTDIKSLACAM